MLAQAMMAAGVTPNALPVATFAATYGSDPSAQNPATLKYPPSLPVFSSQPEQSIQLLDSGCSSTRV